MAPGDSKEKSLEVQEKEEAMIIPKFTKDTGVICVTGNDIPGYKVVRILGTVYGITVRSRNWGTVIGASLRSIAGGEIKWFTTMYYRARNTAVERMISDCVSRGGNAIIAMRFDSTELATFAQCCAYGTACIVEKEDDGRPDAKASLLADI